MDNNVNSKFGAKQTSINMISQIISFAINLAISFFLTPFIIAKLGQEAYGFVGLSANFISYATLITTAINSMAGRFIAVAYYKGDKEDVVKYYSSVIVANVALCFLLSTPAILIILFLPRLLNVPVHLVQDVTALFILVFSHFFVDLIGSTFVNAGYVANRLDMVAMRKTEATLLKGILSFAIFVLLIPRLWFIGLIQLTCSVYNFFRNYQIFKKLMPEIRLSVNKFDIRKIGELVSSGVWNTVSSAGSVIITGLDLLIVNVTFKAPIGMTPEQIAIAAAAATGIVSTAKQIPIYVQSLIVTIANIFAPKQTKLFAEQNYVGMKETLIYSSKIVAIITAIPVVFMIVYGKSFFKLWVPSQDYNLLWIISTTAIILYPIQLVTSPFSAVVSSANKVKLNSLVTLAFAFTGLVTMFWLLYFVDNSTLRKMIIVGTSMVFLTLHSLTFLIPYCAKIIGCKTIGFYTVILRSLLLFGLSTAVCYGLSLVFKANGWITLIISGIAVCLVCIANSIIIVLSKKDRERVFSAVCKIKNKIFK
ncbi:MAG: hypothetical protein IKA61_01275 [Clostridia bacterium]|nr:hypothetical protein [Clostridia bacterium]